MNSESVLNQIERDGVSRPYFFYSLSDDRFEPIGTITTTSIEAATEFFSIQKNLSVEKFNNIYGVMEVIR